MTSMLDTACVEQGFMTFGCPEGNTDPFRSSDVDGDYRVRCWVCGLPSRVPQDSSPTVNYILTDIRFGPNVVDGIVNEDGISSYNVYLCDVNGSRIQTEEVASVEAQGLTAACCTVDLYLVPIAAYIPPEAGGAVRFEIVPVVDIGPLPAGVFSASVVDWTGAVLTSHSWRQQLMLSEMGPATLMMVVALAFVTSPA